METSVGFAPAILTRAGFTGELGYEIWTTPDYFATLYDDLWDAGRDLGLTHFGGRALSSLRLEKGYGSFNKDFRPDYTAAETGLDRFIDFSKADFIGRAAALAERESGPKRKFVVMEVADADAEVVGYESIMKDGKAVGYVTSGAYGHCIDKSLAAGYVPTALANEGETFEIDILGEVRAATVRLEPLYDPERPSAARVRRHRRERSYEIVAPPRTAAPLDRRLARAAAAIDQPLGAAGNPRAPSRSSASSRRPIASSRRPASKFAARKRAKSIDGRAESSTRRRNRCASAAKSSRPMSSQAPASFVLHARNAERHLHVGGNVVNFGPVNGAPHISDREGGRRYGDIEAFRNILKLTHSLGVLHWQGGIVVEPVDVPVPLRHLAAYQAHIEHADIVWAARGVGGVQARDAIAMSAIEHGCSVERSGGAADPDDGDQRQFAAPGRRGDSRQHHDHGRARPMRGDHAVHPDGSDGAGDAGRARWCSRPPRRWASSRSAR